MLKSILPVILPSDTRRHNEIKVPSFTPIQQQGRTLKKVVRRLTQGTFSKIFRFSCGKFPRGTLNFLGCPMASNVIDNDIRGGCSRVLRPSFSVTTEEGETRRLSRSEPKVRL